MSKTHFSSVADYEKLKRRVMESIKVFGETKSKHLNLLHFRIKRKSRLFFFQGGVLTGEGIKPGRVRA